MVKERFIELAYGSKAYFTIDDDDRLHFSGFSNYNREELCASLENTTRFNGGIPYPYTVAMHCINGCRALMLLNHIFREDNYLELSEVDIRIGKLTPAQLNTVKYYFLFHDMCEALVGDIPSPIKTNSQKQLEKEITDCILEHESIDIEDYRSYLDIINMVDSLMGYVEAKKFGKNVSCWSVSDLVLENATYLEEFDLLSSAELGLNALIVSLENKLYEQ